MGKVHNERQLQLFMIDDTMWSDKWKNTRRNTMSNFIVEQFSGNIWEAGLFRNSNKESRLYIFFPSGLHGTENKVYFHGISSRNKI